VHRADPERFLTHKSGFLVGFPPVGHKLQSLSNIVIFLESPVDTHGCLLFLDLADRMKVHDWQADAVVQEAVLSTGIVGFYILPVPSH